MFLIERSELVLATTGKSWVGKINTPPQRERGMSDSASGRSWVYSADIRTRPADQNPSPVYPLDRNTRSSPENLLLTAQNALEWF